MNHPTPPFRGFCSLTLALLLGCLCSQALAEVYIYHGPNGERLISDKPPHPSLNYRLISQRNTFEHAGKILATGQAPPSTRHSNTYQGHIQAASLKFNLDPKLVTAIIQVESGFNPHAVSKAGATGLMQLMKLTAKQYQVRNRFNPRQNIYGGTEHLSHLIKRYDGKLSHALAAYNAGPVAVDKYRGVPPFPETQRYIKKVMAALSNVQDQTALSR